jgi:hypothetical protein
MSVIRPNLMVFRQPPAGQITARRIIQKAAFFLMRVLIGQSIPLYPSRAIWKTPGPAELCLFDCLVLSLFFAFEVAPEL